MKIALPYQPRAQIEMLPLIDTFFLLLAFFMSSMLSMSILDGVPLELPTLRQAARLDPEDLIVISVAKDGQVRLGKDAVRLAELSRRLRAAEHAETVRVAIRADRSVPAGRLVEVLGAVREAGMSRVGLVTEIAEGEPSL